MTDLGGVPRLSEEDLHEELERLYRAHREHSLVALHGTGDEGTVEVDGASVRVVPVRSEIELRERMPPLGADDERIAFLVPFTQDVPMDLAGRFALLGRVRRIGKEARLRRLFGAGEVDASAGRSPLVDYLLRPDCDRRYTVGSGRLTDELLWATWLRVDWGLETDGGLALDALMGWAALDGRGERFREEMERAEATGVRAALLERLERWLGPAGPVVWRAWEQDRGRELLAYAVVFEVLADRDDKEVRFWTRMRLKDRFDVQDEGAAFDVARVLGAEVGAALRYVAQQGPPGFDRMVVKEADALVDMDDLRPHLRASTRLPSAWELRVETLGHALLEGASAPSPKAVARAHDALRSLEGHDRYKDPDQTQQVKQAEMALRLLAWLAVRPDRRVDPGNTPYGDVEALGRWYAEEGGYVDWARRWARGVTAGGLKRGVEAVVAAADQARTELDRRFARALSAWVEAGRPSHQVVPIDHAVQRIAARFLEGHPERRLLVLLFDGMAWAQAVEILRSMGQRAAPWGPLAWHQMKEGRIGEAIHPVVLANLPTITEVSRSAFFAGKAMAPGKKLRTEDDPKRWLDNRHVEKAGGGAGPGLLLKAESHTAAGGATQEAQSLVADESRRMVGIVLNAIDDAIKGNAAVLTVQDWTVDSIASLPVLLDKAREHGRAVLMASDHGHVAAGRFETLKNVQGSGTRWRAWREGDPVHDGEVVFRADKTKGVWAPAGFDGVALPSDEVCIYGGTTGAGEHGGATLAEVVAPCLLVGCEDMPDDPARDDPGLAVRPAHSPAWWHFDVAERPSVLPPKPEPPPKRPKKPVSDKQLALPTAEAP
ncbi:MAG: BREX-2 system phosphatase PglZ, partial [Myxococcota bacterium]